MIEYFVNKKDQTVTAVLDNCEYDAINRIEKKFHSTPFSVDCDSIGYPGSNRYVMSYRYSATVKVHSPDVFNVEVGKKEARNKLIKNYRKGLNKRINRFLCDFRDFSKALPWKDGFWLDDPLDK